ncbi:MAG: peptidoglycan DD-metalloendopeptidase family protein [Comamonas sp.]|nr:peptidoglycan DD-metalloendopeptidase family protein [Candidatus Comamonas equi]
MFLSRGPGAWGAMLLAAGMAAGCAQVNEAPVEDRRGWASTASQVDPAKLPGAENAGKPGYYTVQPGDTLIRIGLEHGHSWKDIARWSNLANPNLIEVGQVVRVVPPGAELTEVASGARPVVSTPIQATTLPPVGAAPVVTAPSVTPVPSTAVKGGDASGLGFIWPASGSLIAGFNESTNKGLDISGKAGDPVVAAADGKVVYSGAGLRGYGHLIILKHNNTYLTAYAHNQKLLVKEDQSVKKGQKIAEMGSSDADRVKLHFEVRRQGKPVDPARYLPAR